MKGLRILLAAGFVAAAMNSIAPAHAQETTLPPSTGAHDFDFLVGEWRVHHRRLKPDNHEWVDFEGTVSNRMLMDGGANIEEHELNAPSGPDRAMGHLVARRALSLRSPRPAGQRPFRERHRHLLRRLHARR
jgi:hypothetical protein